MSIYKYANSETSFKVLASLHSTYALYQLTFNSTEDSSERNENTKETTLFELKFKNNSSHQTAPQVVAMNEEETLIFTADKVEQKCFSVRTCALINSVELPDNLGTPT